mmetsp:Transcript_9979/g.12503  ORF Transcript_9979/g.12503 Transcript_9979/m.12503 type:complete len:356 (-) Transcript_9979:917-1984(-)
MVHGAESHFDADIFTVCNQGDTDNGGDLVDSLLLIFFMLSAQMKHFLYLKDVTRACISASLNDKFTEARSVLVRNQLADLHRWLSCALLSKEKKAETEGEQSHEWVVQVGLLLLHQGLQDGISGILVASAHIDQADGQGGHSLKPCGVIRIQDDWADALEEISSGGASVGEGETEQGANLQIGLPARLELLDQDRLHGIHLVRHTAVDQAKSHEGARNDVVLASFHVLIDLSQTFIDVPKEEHAERCSSGSLTIFLAFEDPVLVALLGQNEQIFAKGGIDEGVDISQSQVLLCTVDAIVLETTILQMALENRVRVLGLHDVEITRQALKMLAKLLVGDDTLQVSILTLIGVPLAG